MCHGSWPNLAHVGFFVFFEKIDWGLYLYYTHPQHTHTHTLSLSLSSLPGNATGSTDAPIILSPASCSSPTLATTADPNFPNDNYANVMLEYKCVIFITSTNVVNYDVAVHYFLKTSVSNYVSKVLTIQAKSS